MLKSLSIYILFMQTLPLVSGSYSDDKIIHPEAKLKLDSEIILEQLYISGKLVRDVLSADSGKYYPNALSEKEIVEKTKLSADIVSKRLKFLSSDERCDSKPPIKKLENGETKYKITPTGIILLRMSPAIDIPILYAEYCEEEQ